MSDKPELVKELRFLADHRWLPRRPIYDAIEEIERLRAEIEELHEKLEYLESFYP